MGASGMFVGAVMVGREKVYMYKLEFENHKRNFEIQNQVCFVMRKNQEICCETLGMYSLINIWPIDKILEDSC